MNFLIQRNAYTLLLAFVVSLFSLSLILSGCEEGPQYDDASQRQVVEAFSKSVFRGEPKLAFQLLSKKDQDLIAEPIAKNQALARFIGNEPWKLLTVIDVTNPYDIKAITPKRSFMSMPKEGEETEVEVIQYNGKPHHYRLVWQNAGWKIELK